MVLSLCEQLNTIFFHLFPQICFIAETKWLILIFSTFACNSRNQHGRTKEKRNRRTRAELEAGVFDAVRQLASEKVWLKSPLRILCKGQASKCPSCSKITRA